MIVDIEKEPITAAAGDSVTLNLTVANTSDVIHEYQVKALGIDHGRYVQVHPSDGLALFPGKSGQLEVTLTIPDDRPATGTTITTDGRNRVGLEVSSELRQEVEVVEVDLQVLPLSAVKVDVTPDLVTMGRRGDFSIKITNTGNDDPNLVLDATAGEDHLELSVWPTHITPRVGQTEYAFMTAQGRRKLFGSPVIHEVTLAATDERSPEEPLVTIVTILQRAWIPLAALLLGGLFVLFGVMAVVLSVGIDGVADAVDKRVDNVELDLLDAQERAAEELRLATGDPDAGSAEGVLRASSDNSPVAGATVEAIPISLDGDENDTSPEIGRKWTDAVSDENGSFILDGLPAGKYVLRVTADGYIPITTKDYPVLARTPRDIEPISLDGEPGKISGSVLELLTDGSTAKSVGATVRLDLVDRGHSGEAAQVVQTLSSGVFSLTGVPTPGVYELQFETDQPGTRSRTVRRVTLNPGEEVVLDPVVLGDRVVELSGFIQSTQSENCPEIRPAGVVGGATIEVIASSADGTAFRTRSLTAGPDVEPADVGSFRLSSLPAPATYSVRATAPGYSTTTSALTLDGNETDVKICPTLFPSTGSVTGTITAIGPNGQALGGVTIVATSRAAEGTSQAFSAEATSLTSNGRYRIAGLPTPGVYDLTFSLAGYEPGSTVVELTLEGSTVERSVVLTPVTGTAQTGSVTGTVEDLLGDGLPGVRLAMTLGETTRFVTTATEPRGSFTLAGLLTNSAWQVRVVDGSPYTVEPTTFLIPNNEDNLVLVLTARSTNRTVVTSTQFERLRVESTKDANVSGDAVEDLGTYAFTGQQGEPRTATVENIAFGTLVIFVGIDGEGNEVLRRPVVLTESMNFDGPVLE